MLDNTFSTYEKSTNDKKHKQKKTPPFVFKARFSSSSANWQLQIELNSAECTNDETCDWFSSKCNACKTLVEKKSHEQSSLFGFLCRSMSDIFMFF